MTADTTVEDVTCLGCGCACDDVRIVVKSGRIVEAPNACDLGRRWLGDGHLSSSIRIDGRDASLEEAIDATVARLEASANPLVYVAPGLSCEAQRAAAAVADLLHARLDSVTSATALPFVVAAQERGFASATFGEIRNRADVVLYWAIDIATRYPRFVSRYADATSPHARKVVAVDVGSAQSTVGVVGHRLSVAPADELATLTALSALVREPTSLTIAAVDDGGGGPWDKARELAAMLLSGRYVAIVIDAEPDDRATRSAQRFDALLSLSHALNDRTRCALVALRGNGNRSGADAVLTSQTGFPAGVDFSRGFPRYDAHASTQPHHFDVALVLGDSTRVPGSVVAALPGPGTIIIGPNASAGSLGSASIAIDTGTAGVHTSGTAFRSDEVPLPLKAPVATALSTVDIVAAIARRLTAARFQRQRIEAATR